MELPSKPVPYPREGSNLTKGVVRSHQSEIKTAGTFSVLPHQCKLLYDSGILLQSEVFVGLYILFLLSSLSELFGFWRSQKFRLDNIHGLTKNCISFM